MVRHLGVWIAALAAATMLVSASAPAEAQDRRQPKAIDLGEEEIIGRPQKPEAFYILQHTSLNYKRLDVKETFIPDLVKSVEDKPF